MNPPSGLPSQLRRLTLLVAAVFVFSQPVRAVVFDTYGDGFWKISNRFNGNSLIVTAGGASQSGGTATEIEKQWQILYNIESDTFRLRNHDTWQCIEALGAGTAVGTAVVEGGNYTAATHQRWKLVDVGGGDFRIVNALSNLALQTDGASPANVTLATASTDTRQYWYFTYQTHYPKKGSAGYENDWSRYKVSWNYSWGKFSNPLTPPHVVFEPMQHNRWWDGLPENLAADSAGFRASAKPVYMLGFNEPDHTDQANMTVAEVIALWPYFQNAKLPLVSPVAASAFGGWLGDFYNQIAANGYRVDFTAVHWYGAPDASSLINHLQSVYNTWGRPVWLTEFANIDWDNNEYWSEEESYRFLAEFLWRAEDLLWLKRYSIFSMTGAPPPNPWDRWGDNSNMFSDSNGGTFTAFGELYAAWDADRTIRAREPYLIHNQGACHRISSTGGTAPGTAWVRESGATAQWTLTNAATAGRYYIQSLNNGRRLRYNGTVLDLALPGTVGTDLEWSLNAATDGYYYIDLPSRSKTLQMNRTNDGNGAPTSLGVTVVNAGTPNETTRFRFIKPYAPLRVSGSEARYDFEGTATDASGGGNNGAVFGTVTYVAGKVGAQAAQFDGSTGYVRIPATVQTDFSIACWIKTTSTGPAGTQWWSGNGIVDGEVSGAAEDFGLALLGNKVAFGAGNPDATVISTAVVNDGLWHHVCATRTRAGVLALYVDGASQGTANGPSWDRFAPALLRVGGRQSGGNFFNGAVDDLRLLNYVLTGSGIAGLINAVPAPWQSADIGSPGIDGYASLSGSTWTVGGGGSDIWNTSDQCRLHAQTFSGDGSIVTRVTFLPTNLDGTTSAFSKAGVMFRATTATDSPFVDLVYSHTQGLRMHYRDTTGAAVAVQGAGVAMTAAPFWLKLARSGNTFTAYYATTTTPLPADWTLLGTHATTLPASALTGLAVSSHDNNLLARAGFTNTTLAPPNTAPTISNVADQTLAENSATAALPVTIGDAATAAASLTLSAVSSNQTLVPNANIVLGGSGADRTVTVTPAANQAGTATVTLTVSDGELTAADPFIVNVQLSPGGSWRQTNFGTMANTGATADTADPDNDGCNNLLERALNGNPNASGPALTQPLTDTGALAIAFTRTSTATDLTLTVQAADALAGPWTDLAQSTGGGAFSVLAAGATVNETGTGATRSVQVRDLYSTGDPAHPRRFLRVRAQN